MKKTILFLFLLAAMPALAQSELKFGYMSYEAVMQAMPEYAQLQQDMEQLRSQYDAELKRVEDDFNKKYEEFLDGQKNFPKTILQKRQSELQEMLDKNIAFKKESQQLLCKAECDAKAPLKERLDAAVAKVGQERGYAFIIDTDRKATLWVNADQGEDITKAVKQLLNEK